MSSIYLLFYKIESEGEKLTEKIVWLLVWIPTWPLACKLRVYENQLSHSSTFAAMYSTSMIVTSISPPFYPTVGEK